MIFLPWIAFGVGCFWLINEGQRAKRVYLHKRQLEKLKQEEQARRMENVLVATLRHYDNPQKGERRAFPEGVFSAR